MDEDSGESVFSGESELSGESEESGDSEDSELAAGEMSDKKGSPGGSPMRDSFRGSAWEELGRLGFRLAAVGEGKSGALAALGPQCFSGCKHRHAGK